MLVESYSCFAYEIAQNSSQHARALFFDREIKRVTEIAWDQAVNDPANLWQSIFVHALGPERAGQLYGIPAPVKEIGNGSVCRSAGPAEHYFRLTITCPRCPFERWVTPEEANAIDCLGAAQLKMPVVP